VTQLEVEVEHPGEKDHGSTHARSIRRYRPGATIMVGIEEIDVMEEVEEVGEVDQHQAETIGTLILGSEAGLLRPDEEATELVDPRRRIKTIELGHSFTQAWEKGSLACSFDIWLIIV
jgi:hypothetical protein